MVSSTQSLHYAARDSAAIDRDVRRPGDVRIETKNTMVNEQETANDTWA